MPFKNADKILDFLNSSILQLDNELNIHQVNATAEVFFDTSKTVLLNRPFTSLFSPIEENSILSSLHLCLQHNQQITEHEAIITFVNGRSLACDYSIHPFYEDKSFGLMIEIRPVDRHLEIAREGQRVTQQLASQQLARGMAHEIKNPLGGIRGAAQLLEGEIENPVLKEYTDVIIREADRLQGLMNNMLGPNKKIEKLPINILQVLEHVISLILAEFPGLNIHRDYDPSIPELQADKNQLIQAFLNIARNSAQAVEIQGEITFRTRISHQHVLGHKRYQQVIQVDIIDDGPGIDNEILENIFLPMVTNKPEGTGLGLPIAQQIIFGHNGLIQRGSEDGKTLFTTLLPIEPDS